MSVPATPTKGTESIAKPESDGTGLPEGWIMAELQELATMRLGKMLDAAKQTGESLPYLRNINVRWGTIDVNALLTMRFKEQEAAEFAIEDGDVLVCEGGEPGRAAVWNRGPTNIKFQKAIHRIRVLDSLDPHWLMYQFRIDAISGTLADYFTGSTIKHLTGVALKRYAIRLPPLREQRRIVSKLELLLGKVSSSQQRLLRVPRLLKRFRQSVLAAACSGRLTADWREECETENEKASLESGEKLLDRILTERRRNWQGRSKYQEIAPPGTSELPNLPETWTWVTWEMVLANGDGAFKRGPFGSALTKSIFVEKGFKIYEQYCPINDDCSFSRYYITPEKFAELQSFEVKAGDYLISCSGVTLGRITRVPEQFERGIINQALLRVRMNEQVIDHSFFLHLFRSVFFQKAIFDNSTGSAIPNVKGVKELKAMALPLPPLAEQQEIARRVEKLFAFADQIEARLKHAQTHVDRLTQSILAKAFRGELVPTEAELARRDGRDYEPASALLDRIRNEQAKESSAAPKRSKTAGIKKARK